MILRTPSSSEFQRIKSYIREFELDDRCLQAEEFSAAFRGEELVGFGRLRKHADCTELCSLGVVTPHRRQGIGKALVADLIRRSETNIHLVCIIPGFFEPFGFRISKSYPSSIRDKLNYCISSLAVPETYVAMVLQK
jgi:N-acetylglutamate synthase-like GNAT family acetyltransferase